MSEKTAFERFHLGPLIVATVVLCLVAQLVRWIASPPPTFEEYIADNNINDITYRAVGVYVNARDQTFNYSLSSDPSTYYTIKIDGNVENCNSNLLLAKIGYAFIDKKPLESPLTKPGLEKEKAAYLIGAACPVNSQGQRSSESAHSYELEKYQLPEMTQIKFSTIE